VSDVKTSAAFARDRRRRATWSRPRCIGPCRCSASSRTRSPKKRTATAIPTTTSTTSEGWCSVVPRGGRGS